ncbi:hypothetical protein [Variovorax sp. GB1P17]|uniref:hypothetical protein n=1 Tax=Variovorax sp. GB1P17 TaxID=3443740 RepID=UPI003F44C652
MTYLFSPQSEVPALVVIRPRPVQELKAELEAFEPFGWRFGRNALTPVGQRAAEQNLLNDHDRAERKLAYLVALKETTDAEWRYEMASGEYYRDGRRQIQRLWDMQVELDPSGDVWRSIVPKGFAIPGPRLPGIACSQCGQGFGRGHSGFSHCADHAHLTAVAS